MRYALALLLTVYNLSTGCWASDAVACDQLSGSERVYPFTGAWEQGGVTARLCLSQHDARTVSGTLGSRPVVGSVHPDGTLMLALGTRGGAELYALRLSHDTLTIEYGVTGSGEPTTRMSGHWIRIPRDGH